MLRSEPYDASLDDATPSSPAGMPTDRLDTTGGADPGADAQANADADADADAQPAEPLTWAMVVFSVHCFLSFLICSMDRINLSIAIIPMAAEYGWTDSQVGLIQSIFFLGYMATPLLGGRLADERGGRPVLAVSVVLWSLCTILTPPAAKLPGLFPLLAIRVALGASEGSAMPAMNALIAAAVPPAFRARSLAFIYSGMYAGSIVGLVATPPLVRAMGYPVVFYIFGAVGVAWVALFLATTKQPVRVRVPAVDPLADPTAARARAAHDHDADLEAARAGADLAAETLLPDGPGKPRAGARPTLREIFSTRAMWAIIIAHFCCTWGYFVLVAWLPSYFSERFSQDLSSSALYSALPWVAMFVSANVGGACADRMLAAGVSTTVVRKTMQGVGFIGPALFLGLVVRARSASAACPLVAAALACSAWSQSGVYVNHQDIGPHIAGTLLGISNMFASMPGLIGVYVSGLVLEITGRHWESVFYMAIFFYMFGFVVYTTFGTSKRIW